MLSVKQQPIEEYYRRVQFSTVSTMSQYKTRNSQLNYTSAQKTEGTFRNHIQVVTEVSRTFLGLLKGTFWLISAGTGIQL